VLATNGVFSLLASPVAGWLSDRIGGRITLAGALVLMALGVGSLALAHEPWQAYLSMALVGWGNGSFWPSQSTTLKGSRRPSGAMPSMRSSASRTTWGSGSAG
jgi:MFS family permease